MNRTLLTLTGLLLAAPLAAQQPSANEMKASELLQLSAQKAMAGHETEAAKLAEMAMELLAAKGTPEEGEIHMVFEENDGHLKGNVVIVDGPDGRKVIEYIESEDVVMGIPEASIGFAWSEQEPEGREIIVEVDGLHELGYGGNVWHEKGHQGGEWHTDPGGSMIWMQDGGDHHFSPMDGGDLHQQLRDIQHELESLRHELHALRSEMGGGRRGGMQGQRRSMRFNGGGNWFPEGNHDLRGGGRIIYQKDFSPGQMQRTERHRMEGMPQNMRLRGLVQEGLGGIMELQGISGTVNIERLHEMGGMGGMGQLQGLHELHLSGDQGSDFDFDFDVPEGAEMHKEVVVIVNGEKFTGDAAMKKLEELNIQDMGEGQIRVRVEGQNGAFPTPPKPPKAPQQHRRRSNGHDHEDA